MLAKCPFVLLLVAAAAAQDRLTPESLWQLQRVGDLQLAPDGEHLLFSVRSTDLAQNRGSTRLYVLAVGGGSQATDLGAGSLPAWVPGNVRNVLLADGNSLQRVDPATPAVRTDLGLPAGFGNLKVSPTGTHVAYTRDVKIDPDLHDRHQDLPLANARAYDDLMVRHWDSWKDGTYSHLFVRSLADGPEIDLMAGDAADTPMKPFGGAEQFCWSPDGTMLCYTCKRVGDPEASTDSSLWLVPATGGKAESITPGMPGFDQDPAWSPDGRYIAFGSMARGGFEADRMRLFVHDRQTKTNTELLPTFDASVHGLQWTLDSKQLFFTVETEGTTQVYRCTLADRTPIPVTKGRHQLDGIQVSPDAGTVYALRATMERPAEVVRVDVATGAITALTDVNGAVFARLAVPSVEAEWFPATDGKKIHAWVVKPPDFDPNRRWPMILICQGGPQSMVGQGFSFRWNYHLMAAQGYVVVAVNRRGLPGFGQEWNDQISRDWGGQAMQDLLAVTDAMQERPWIDRARCAAAGASFGGYTIYWLMGHAGDRFAAMIAHCGVFNLESMYLATEELWFVNWDLGGPFWGSPEVQKDYVKFSPHRAVGDWKTPLLVIHGERDFRVPYDQGLQAFTAAQLRGVPSRLLMFPEEGHWILKPQNGVLWQREFFGWLARWCGAGAPRK